MRQRIHTIFKLLFYRAQTSFASIAKAAGQPTEWRSRLCWAFIVGFAGAVATIVFRESIGYLERLTTGRTGELVDIAKQLPMTTRLLFPVIGGLAAGFCLVGARGGDNKDAGDYMEVATSGNGKIPFRQTLMRSLSSLFSIASGGSLGREGSMVQLAALSASVAGQFGRLKVPELRLLVACGAAAGITAAYSAPIAGALFVSEIVLGSIAMETFGPVVVSCAVANIVMREFGGYRTPYVMPSFPTVDGIEMICFLALGAICGLGAPVYLRLLSFTKIRFSSLGVPLPLRLAIGGVVVGIISMWWPQVWGNGYEVVNSILHEPWTWEALLCLLVLKVVATAATVGSGAVGGVFTPTIFVGAAAGCLFGMGVHALWPVLTSAPYAYAMVGMAAFLSATTLAPVVAILMIFEMTLSYQIILPLMLSCVIAFFVARSRVHIPMYNVLYHRTCRERKKSELSQTQIEELIQPATTVVALDTGLSELLSMFQKHSVRYLYVVDKDGLLRGSVELKNVLQNVETGDWRSEKTAADYMQRDVRALCKSMTAAQALSCFLEFHGERLPVIEREARPVLIGAVRKTALLNLYWEIAGLH